MQDAPLQATDASCTSSALSVTHEASGTTSSSSSSLCRGYVGVLPQDMLESVFLYLDRTALGICHNVVSSWRHSIESNATLNLESRTQHLGNQCYDECYFFASLDAFGTDVDFCFAERPPASLHTEEGWVVWQFFVFFISSFYRKYKGRGVLCET